MIKALLFDADGVLVNGEMFSNHLLRDHGLDSEVTAPFFKGPFTDCVIGKADLKAVIAPYLQQWGWNSWRRCLLSVLVPGRTPA